MGRRRVYEVTASAGGRYSHEREADRAIEKSLAAQGRPVIGAGVVNTRQPEGGT